MSAFRDCKTLSILFIYFFVNYPFQSQICKLSSSSTLNSSGHPETPTLSFIWGHDSSANNEMHLSHSLSILSCLKETKLGQGQLLNSLHMWPEGALLSLWGATLNIVAEACWEQREEDWFRERLADRKERLTHYLGRDNLGMLVKTAHLFPSTQTQIVIQKLY